MLSVVWKFAGYIPVVFLSLFKFYKVFPMVSCIIYKFQNYVILHSKIPPILLIIIYFTKLFLSIYAVNILFYSKFFGIYLFYIFFIKKELSKLIIKNYQSITTPLKFIQKKLFFYYCYCSYPTSTGSFYFNWKTIKFKSSCWQFIQIS